MLRHSILLGISFAVILQSAQPERTPILLELFTSLGCSSCPPADKLLAEIDRQQPIPGARLIVLSEHVDYWNTPSWSDHFSSSAFTDRQKAYDARLNVEPYTPQLIVDGTAALLGSNWPKTADVIQRVLPAARTAVHVTATRADGKAQIEISAGPGATNKLLVFLAFAHNRAESVVNGGENAGHTLSEVAVAYSIKQLGKIDGGGTFSKSLAVELPSKSQPGDLRVVAFLRKSDTLQIVGADDAIF